MSNKIMMIKYTVTVLAVRPMPKDAQDDDEPRTASLLTDLQSKRDYIQDDVAAGNFNIRSTEISVEG